MKKILETLKNKWAEYLLEILVIMIGILGAYQLDEWREKQRDKIESDRLLENIKLESQFNLVEVRKNILTTKNAAYSGLRLLELISSGESASDYEIDSLIYNFMGIPSLNTSNGALLDIISTGKINLIQNDSLRLLLLSFNGRVEKIIEHEKRTNEVLQRNLVGYLYEHYALTKMDAKLNSFNVDWPLGKSNRRYYVS
jgi:hypothetical protein